MAELQQTQTNNNNITYKCDPGELEGSANPVPTLAELMALLEGTDAGAVDTELSDDEGSLPLPAVQTVHSMRVVLKGGGPWGFTLCGGADVRTPLRVAEIEPGGRAAVNGSLQVGDCITSVNDVQCGTITEAVQLIQSAFRTLTLGGFRGNVEPTTPLKSPEYLRQAREAQVREKPLAPQDDSIMYRESKHSLQSGQMKMKARQKPSRGESFCIGSVGKSSLGGASRSSLSPLHSRNYENLQSQSRVDGSPSDNLTKQGQPFSQLAYKHASQEDLLERGRRVRELTDALPNSIGGRSGPLSPAKSTPALSQAAMEDVVSHRHYSPSKPSFHSAKSSPNIHQELDVTGLGEPPKLVRPSAYAEKHLNLKRPGLRDPHRSVWEGDKVRSTVTRQSSPRDKYRPNSPPQSQPYPSSQGSSVQTYHPDTSFQPIVDKENYGRPSSQHRVDYSKHDYHNVDYHGLSAGYEPSDSGTSDSELEDPPAIPPPPPPESLLNPALYPPCSPPAPPVRDSATIKFCKVNQSHEKYPSWPVTAPSIRGTTDPSQPITSRAESWSDHTNTSSEFPRKQRMAYGPFQPNLRPLTEKNSPLAERKTEEGKSRNASDPGLKSDVMYHASVAKISDIGEERMKSFYNSQPGYPPPKYDSDGHNLGDKEYSVPSPPERDIPIATSNLPPSNLSSPVPKQYRTRYPTTDHASNQTDVSAGRLQNDHKGSSLPSPREESVRHSGTSQVSSDSSHLRTSSVTNTGERSVDHYAPKRVDSRGYIVTPRPCYNTGTQTEVHSKASPAAKREKRPSPNTRHAEIQVNDVASQTSPKRPDSLGDQWSASEEKPTQTRLSWRSNDSDSGTGRPEGVESPGRMRTDSMNVRKSDSISTRSSDSVSVRNSESLSTRSSYSMNTRNSDSIIARRSDSIDTRSCDSINVSSSDYMNMMGSDSMNIRESDSMNARNGASLNRRGSPSGRERPAVEDFRQQSRNSGRKSEGTTRDYQRDFQYNERIRDIRERNGSNELRNFDRGHPQNTHRKEENRETVPLEISRKYDGAMNPAQRTKNHLEDKSTNDNLTRDKPSVIKGFRNDSDTQDVKQSYSFSNRASSGRRSEPPLLHVQKQGGSDMEFEGDKTLRSEGSDSSLPSFYEYTPSTAPLLRMLSKEMYGQHISARPPYQHDKSLSFSSQENSRSIGSPTPSSQYGNMKEAESYSSVLIYSDVSSGPFGRDDFGSQQSLGSQFSLLQEAKPMEHANDRSDDKTTSSEPQNSEEPLSPRELRKAMRSRYSFDNTFLLVKQANQPTHKHSSSECNLSGYNHNYVNTYDLEDKHHHQPQQLSPRCPSSVEEPISPSSSDQRPPQSLGSGKSSSQSLDQEGNCNSYKSHAVSASSTNLSHPSVSQSGMRTTSKSSEDLSARTPVTSKGMFQPSTRTHLSSNNLCKKHSRSGSSSDQNVMSPVSSGRWQQDESPSDKSSKLTRKETSTDLSAQSDQYGLSGVLPGEQGDSVFLDSSSSYMQKDKPPQGRKRGVDKLVTRQESMKRAMGTFDEVEQTLYTTTHLNKTSKSWNNLQDAKKEKSKVPPRSQSYSNYQGLHSARSHSDSNRLEQIKESSEISETKSESLSRGSSQPNLSRHSQREGDRKANEAKLYNPKMWEDDLDVGRDTKGSNLKRTTSEQIRTNKKRDQPQEERTALTSKPPSNSGRPGTDNQVRYSEVETRKTPQQALLNFVERKKGRSMGSSSSQTSSEGGSALSSPKALTKWPSTSSETMVKSIHRSESFSESTLSGGSDSRRHSTSSLQSNREDRWAEGRKEVRSSALPAPVYAQEERVTKALRLEPSAGALAPRPYKPPVPAAPFKSGDDDAPPALPPRNYRKFDEGQPPANTGNNLRRFSTEGRLDKTPQRRLDGDTGNGRFDSPKEDTYVAQLRQEARRRLSEHVMPNPARINFINSKPASYISHSVATQPMVPQEATAIPQGQENSGTAMTPTSETKPPAGPVVQPSGEPVVQPPTQYETNRSQKRESPSSFLTQLRIEEEGDSLTTVTPPDSSPELPLPSPPRPTPGEEVRDQGDLPPPPSFIMEDREATDNRADSQGEGEEVDGQRYPEGSYGSHKNNRSGARPFGSYQRSSSGPFHEPTGSESSSDGHGQSKKLGERAWRSVQSLPYQASSPTGTPPPDARSSRWLHAQGPASGEVSPVNTLPRVTPQRRASDNFQAASVKVSSSFNTTVTCISSRATTSRESLTNGDVDTSSPSVRERVSNFERSKCSERLNTSANVPSPAGTQDSVSKTKAVNRSSENLSNSAPREPNRVGSPTTHNGRRPKEQSRVESPVNNSRYQYNDSKRVESPVSDSRGRYYKDQSHVESPVSDSRGRYYKAQSHVESPVSDSRGRYYKAQSHVESPVSDSRGRYYKDQSHVESPVSDSRGRCKDPRHVESAISDKRVGSSSVNSTSSPVSVTNNSAIIGKNVKRISVDNFAASPLRTCTNSAPKPSPREEMNAARPETLAIIHRREKSREEEECDRHAKLLAGQIDDSSLSQVISPPFEMRSAMDYMNGLFEVTSPSDKGQPRSTSSASKKDVSPKNTARSVDTNKSSSDRKSESPLPANSPYWISSAKAKLIERMRETDSEQLTLGEDEDSIEQKKEELMTRINQKLKVLQEARDDVQQDIDGNNALGKQVLETVEEKCKGQNEKDKYKSYIGDLEKIVRLLLKLSGLLARAENALSCLAPDADQQQRSALVDKRNHLMDQHEEAKRLKADIDKRRDVVAGILKNYLNEEEIGDYMHFVEMKSRLTIEFQELEDKITLGQEQLQALKRSMPDDS
ncbi:uncharacterized protein LOC135473007 [Liolophura sinensis]|uniref:uncharacterized protein LOC135473007 n=1 Tax=Liolophura sinensis TaxID=3198878 RepID=UPI00315929A3